MNFSPAQKPRKTLGHELDRDPDKEVPFHVPVRTVCMPETNQQNQSPMLKEILPILEQI